MPSHLLEKLYERTSTNQLMINQWKDNFSLSKFHFIFLKKKNCLLKVFLKKFTQIDDIYTQSIHNM